MSEAINENKGKEEVLKEYSLFLGCVIPNRYPMIEKATREVMKVLNVKINEMNGASCCPAPGVFRSVDNFMWISLAARNLTIAEENNTELLTMCNGCYGTLLEVDHILKNNQAILNKTNEILKEIGRTYKGTTEVRHIMDVLYNDIGLDRIKACVKHKLGLNVAVHYGCHLLKPSSIRPFKGESEHPTFFDELVQVLGCKSVSYQDKFLCCGAGGAVRSTQKETSLMFTIEKLRQMRKAGADCIVVACPFCHLQFDMGQTELKFLLEEDEEPFRTPVVYITQLMGLAMGLSPNQLGMKRPESITGVTPMVPVELLLQKLSNIIENEKGGTF